MSNSVKYSIDGDTNAEQVSGRVKASLNGLDKQMEGIGKRFGNSFKDIFLSFLGPMALMGAAMAYIGKLIADNQKKRDDANQAAIDQTNKLMSAEDNYYANKRNNEAKNKATVEEAKTQRETTTREFLENDPRGKDITASAVDKNMMLFGFTYQNHEMAARMPRIQEQVQALISGDMKSAGAGTGDVRGTPFKSPEGFSNVVGVGANPVLDAMNEQLVLLKTTNDLLTEIARGKSGGGVPVDFTKQEIPIKK